MFNRRIQQLEPSLRTERQALLIGVALGVLVVGCICWDDYRQTRSGARTAPLSAVDVNYDPMYSLCRLPGIGPARAAKIMAYRENMNGQPAFESVDELTAVHGIGAKTAEKIKSWAVFPGMDGQDHGRLAD